METQTQTTTGHKENAMRYAMDFNGTEYFIYDTLTMQTVFSSSTHGGSCT